MPRLNRIAKKKGKVLVIMHKRGEGSAYAQNKCCALGSPPFLLCIILLGGDASCTQAVAVAVAVVTLVGGTHQSFALPLQRGSVVAETFRWKRCVLF